MKAHSKFGHVRTNVEISDAGLAHGFAGVESNADFADYLQKMYDYVTLITNNQVNFNQMENGDKLVRLFYLRIMRALYDVNHEMVGAYQDVQTDEANLDDLIYQEEDWANQATEDLSLFKSFIDQIDVNTAKNLRLFSAFVEQLGVELDESDDE